MNTSSKSLLQILIEELPKRGGWPEGATDARQDKDAEICFSGSCGISYDFHYSHLAVDAFDNGRNGRLVTVTRDQYETALEAKGIHKVDVRCQVVDADGWIEWAGGECPVPEGTLVDIKQRDNWISEGSGADNFRWTHNESRYDIIAYRLHQPQEANSRANDERLEADLNECIGQQPEDLDQLTRLLVEDINYSFTEITLANAYKIAANLIDAGYRKQ